MANTDNASSRKTKIKYMILAIVLAIASWFVVMYTANPDITKTFTGIKIELTGGDVLRDSGYIITDEEDLPKLSVKLRGKRGDLMKAIDNIRIYADVSGISDFGKTVPGYVHGLPMEQQDIIREFVFASDALEHRILELALQYTDFSE